MTNHDTPAGQNAPAQLPPGQQAALLNGQGPLPDTAELRGWLTAIAASSLNGEGPEQAVRAVWVYLEYTAHWPRDTAVRWAGEVTTWVAGLPADQQAGLADRYRSVQQHLVDAGRAERRRTRLERMEDEAWARRELAGRAWTAPGSASLADELKMARATAAYRVPGLAGMNHNVLVAGPRKTGKTQLLVNYTGSLSRCHQEWDEASGQQVWRPGPFLGLSLAWLAGNAAFANLEMDADDWRDVFRALPPGSYNSARIFPLHLRGQPFPIITNAAARAWFITWLRERAIEVLLLDTWGQLCARNGVRKLNDDGEVLPVLAGLDEIKAEAGVSSLYCSIHMPHQTGEPHLERFKGAGAVGDWADCLWTFTADEEGTRYLGAVGRARISSPDSALSYDPATGLLAWSLTGTKAQTKASRQRSRMLAALEQAGSKGLLTEALLGEAGGHADDARKMAKAMERDGELVTETKGRAVRWWLPGQRPSVQEL